MEIDGKKIKLQIWDTAGQERFKNIISSYYRGANGIFLVYDITDKESFEDLNKWLVDIEKHANKNVCKYLIGNKCHLEDKRIVSYKEGEDFAIKNGMKFVETSEKNNINIIKTLESITKDMLNIASNKDSSASLNNKEKIVHLTTKDKKNKNCIIW